MVVIRTVLMILTSKITYFPTSRSCVSLAIYKGQRLRYNSRGSSFFSRIGFTTGLLMC